MVLKNNFFLFCFAKSYLGKHSKSSIGLLGLIIPVFFLISEKRPYICNGMKLDMEMEYEAKDMRQVVWSSSTCHPKYRI